MLVKVAPIGERVSEVNVEPGTSVSDILGIAGIADNGRSILINNTGATLDSQVTQEGSIIVLAAKMKGGSKK